MEHQVDVAIIGAGTAGLTARRAAKSAGKTAVMIDPGPLGTTCARVGCMPSKLLIAAADAAEHTRAASTFGVQTTIDRIDGEQVMARVRSERDRFVGFVVDAINGARDEGELIDARAQFTDVDQLTLSNGDTVRFNAAVIATGSSPFIPPPYRKLGDRLIDSGGLFDLQTLPDSVLVVGGGVIGLELGQALHNLAVRTVLLGVGGNLGPLRDPVVQACVQEVMSARMDVHADHVLHSVEPVKDGVRVVFDDSKGTRRDETFQYVLMAAGRRQNLSELKLEAAGATPDERGKYTISPATLQLEGLPIFVAGDANGFHPLLHEAADDGRIAGDNAARGIALAPQRRASLGVVFTDPQMASVGQNYSDLDGCDVSVGSLDYGDQGRARVMAKNYGAVRVYGDRKSGQLLGAEMFGPSVEHTAHLLAWAVQQNMTVSQILEMPFYHPVVEEGIRTALRDLHANLGRRSPMDCPCSEDGPGA